MELFKGNFHPVKPLASKHGSRTVPNPGLIMGLELEMEQFPAYDTGFGGVNFVPDGSLRNGGIEGVTQPIVHAQMIPFLEAFYKKFGISSKNYSERCSTHVHVNVQNLPFDTIASIVLVYQTVERLLFNFIGHDRVNNIFCVPWYESGLSYKLVNKLCVPGDCSRAVTRWQKYTALNLIPVHEKGTMEFRHLPGTCDTEYIARWLRLIARMFSYAEKTGVKELQKIILAMNTISNYSGWLESVFEEDVVLLTNSDYQALLSKGVTDSKLMVLEPKKKEGEGNAPQADEVFRQDADVVLAHLAGGVGDQLLGLLNQRPAPAPVRRR